MYNTVQQVMVPKAEVSMYELAPQAEVITELIHDAFADALVLDVWVQSYKFMQHFDEHGTQGFFAADKGIP